MRHIGPQDASASCLVSAHDRILGTHTACWLAVEGLPGAAATFFAADVGKKSPLGVFRLVSALLPFRSLPEASHHQFAASTLGLDLLHMSINLVREQGL